MEILTVEVCYAEGSKNFHYIHLTNKNKKIEIAACGTLEDSIAFSEFITKIKIPVILILNGKGVLFKKINSSLNAALSIAEITKQNFPTINAEEFYVQYFEQSAFSNFISLCRKEQVNDLLSEFTKYKCEVVSIYIGAPTIIGLQPIWGNHNSIKSSLHRFDLTNELIDDIIPEISNLNDQIKFDSLTFSAQYSLAFAGGISYLSRRTIDHTDNTVLSSLKKRHEERIKVKILSIAVISIAFIISLLNLVIFSNYFEKSNHLETELSVYQGKYDQINLLLAEYQKNKNLIENSGALNKNHLSEYADKIGQTLPREINLTELYFNPLKNDPEDFDTLASFENNTLIIKGNCEKSFIVNEWLNVLKMQNFIREVSLEKFIYSKDEFIPNFEIKINTK